MSELQSHHETQVSSERSFGVVFTAVFALIGLWPLVRDESPRLWALVVAGVFLAVTLVAPRVLRPLNLLWFKFGMLLGRIVTPIVMFLVFVVAVLPTALLMRAFGKDPMNRKTNAASASYWVPRDATADRENSMKNQF
jgi:predicted membrane metal-binding protein